MATQKQREAEVEEKIQGKNFLLLERIAFFYNNVF
jgi:hypothetical protein